MTEERDLGVIIQNDLKCSSHCIKFKTADKVLGMIERTFSARDKSIILQLYKSLVRPHIEYSVQALGPHFQRGIGLLEGVQRRGNKLISIKDETYEDRLSCLKLTMLESRR